MYVTDAQIEAYAAPRIPLIALPVTLDSFHHDPGPSSISILPVVIRDVPR